MEFLENLCQWLHLSTQMGQPKCIKAVCRPGARLLAADGHVEWNINVYNFLWDDVTETVHM